MGVLLIPPECRRKPSLVLKDNSSGKGILGINIWSAQKEYKEYNVMFPVGMADTFYTWMLEYKSSGYTNLISEEELLRDHSGLPHGGSVIGVGETTPGVHQVVEFSLHLDSNPEFTSSVMIAYGRATYRLWKEGAKGCKNFSDVPLKYLSPLSDEDIISHIL